VTYPRLEIDENGTRNVVLIVCLIEKHVLAIAAFRRPLFENALFVDPVFGTESLPVHGTHFKIVMPSLDLSWFGFFFFGRECDAKGGHTRALDDGGHVENREGAHFGFHIARVELSRFREA